MERNRAVVLVHGLATPSHRTWSEAGWAELLGEFGRTVLTVDLPGHGATPGLPDETAYGDLGTWLVGQLPAEPVDAIGFSLGGRLLLGVAARHPGRIARLVVAGVGAQLLSLDPERGARIARAIAGQPDAEDPNATYFARLAEHDDVDRDALVAIVANGGGAVSTAELAGIDVPVLVVLGDRDDAGPLEPLVDAIPGARGVTLRNTDHFATPKALGFLDAALEFLA
jgi:pimeloyl-ACP methyl ester carboxylesterase